VLVSAGYDRRVVVWDRSDFRPLCSRLVEHEEPIQALAVHPSGELLCTGSWDGTIRLFGVELLDQRGVFSRPPFSAVESLCWSGDGALLCAGSSDGTVTIWRACR
jgi:WD40 repeat protein